MIKTTFCMVLALTVLGTTTGCDDEPLLSDLEPVDEELDVADDEPLDAQGGDVMFEAEAACTPSDDDDDVRAKIGEPAAEPEPASIACTTDAQCESYCTQVLDCQGGICWVHDTCRCFSCA